MTSTNGPESVTAARPKASTAATARSILRAEWRSPFGPRLQRKSPPSPGEAGAPNVVFRYEIEGDKLSLSPVITPAMKKEALAQPLEFSDAGWSVAVSYPGQIWKRVDCSGWC